MEAVYPGYGPAHGFDFTVPSPAGFVTVDVYGVNVGAGTGDTHFVTRQVLVGGNPFGNLELVNPGAGTVEVRGWAIDPDTADPIGVHVYIDGAWGGALTADQPRPDVAAAYPLYGANHGFDHTFTGLTPGLHQVCVYEINTGAGTTNPLLTCRTVSVR